MSFNTPQARPKPLANIYVDGFNLYYGAIRNTGHKWLDLRKMAAFMLPEYRIGRIRYFTARVKARPGDPGQPTRQDAYLRALRTLPRLSIHEGFFLESQH